MTGWSTSSVRVGVRGTGRVMWIPVRVNVTERARHLLRGAIQDFAAGRRIEVPGRPGMDLRVAALIKERREVANLQLESRDDQRVGPRELQDERRLGVDEVRVLVPLHPGESLHAV